MTTEEIIKAASNDFESISIKYTFFDTNHQLCNDNNAVKYTISRYDYDGNLLDEAEYELDENMTVGPTPAGGIFCRRYYFDANGNSCEAENAVKMIGVEFDSAGNSIQETVLFSSEQKEPRPDMLELSVRRGEAFYRLSFVERKINHKILNNFSQHPYSNDSDYGTYNLEENVCMLLKTKLCKFDFSKMKNEFDGQIFPPPGAMASGISINYKNGEKFDFCFWKEEPEEFTAIFFILKNTYNETKSPGITMELPDLNI